MPENTVTSFALDLAQRAYAAMAAAFAPMRADARDRSDGEQNTATVLLIVITIGIGVLLFALAKNNLKPVIEDAGRNLNNYAAEGSTWTTPTRP